LREFKVGDRVISIRGDHGTVEHVASDNDLWSVAPYAVRHDSDGRIYWHTEKGLKHE
jgi:hypothetical protein